MEDAGDLNWFHHGLGKDLEKVPGTSAPLGGDHRNGRRRANGIDQFEVETGVRSILIAAIGPYLSPAQLFLDLLAGDGIRLPVFSPVLDGALLEAMRDSLEVMPCGSINR